MKRLAFMAFVSLLSLSSFADWRDEIDSRIFAPDESASITYITNGLVAHWKLNDNTNSTVVLDSWSTNNGTAYSNTSLIHVSGKIDGAITFGTALKYITTAAQSKIGAAGTMCCWFRPKWSNGEASSRVILISRPGSFDNIIIQYDQPASWNFGWTAGGGDYYVRIPSNAVTVSSGVWTHLLFTWDDSGNRTAAYQDGTFKAEKTNALTTTTLSAPFLIGSYDGGQTCNGDIDDARIYNRALTTNEIQQLYNGGTGTEY
jgi:hypothetical protein